MSSTIIGIPKNYLISGVSLVLIVAIAFVVGICIVVVGLILFRR